LIRHPNLRGLVTISSALEADVVADFPQIADKIIVAHDGADPVSDHRVSAASPWGDAPTVGYVGHLYPGKGFEMIPPLAQRVPQATFHVVGGDAATVDAIV